MREASAFWKINIELIAALDSRLGPPIDSYLNGAQVWLLDEVEYRLHPVTGFELPSEVSHHDLWDLVTAPGASLLPESFWDGLEAIPFEAGQEPATLAALGSKTLGRDPDHYGMVDHDQINAAWDATNGAVSICQQLIDQFEKQP